MDERDSDKDFDEIDLVKDFNENPLHEHWPICNREHTKYTGHTSLINYRFYPFQIFLEINRTCDDIVLCSWEVLLRARERSLIHELQLKTSKLSRV